MQRKTPTGTYSALDDIPGLTQIGGVALVANVIGLFAWTWVAVTVFGFALLVVLVISAPTRQEAANSSLYEAGQVVFVLSVLAALVGGVLVGGFQLVTFKLTAAVVLGLFGLAVILHIAGGAFAAPGSVLSVLLAAGLAFALYVLPPPPGSTEDKREESKVTTIVVDVRRGDGGPVAYARACATWKDEGQPDPAGDGDCALTGEHGQAGIMKYGRLPGNVAVVRVSADGFADARRELADMRGGEIRNLTVVLDPLTKSPTPGAAGGPNVGKPRTRR